MSFGGKVNSAANTAIPGEGWPELSTDEFRQLRRIPHTFDNDSMAAAVSIAALNIQQRLASLLVDDIPPQLNAAKTAAYKRAVYGLAHADLLPEFATQDRRKEGESVATDEPEQEARFITQSNQDVRLLLGRSANGIDSI
ncbi:head completion/stabilization protein [Vibrio parahaemolyticus]|uniref:head completion/stabilization protein n=1 Tax=Vibrio parahaemolyticus TaxID=670 RepID=UPI0013311DAE|nr:head completion/stabilization protein [Vibrio parahaemolyticus]MBY3749681.1 head completion/stabilization protein [Vibrio parahaemolyticus]MBY3760375.1 head completion/stabilization protein [Vibrio parahaemolyticus]MBY3765373.1 head completion/stabilization protein [Vibrio parahaemolyticus]MBY3776140.1 head completion/stabilization protein [Vibrio parahaemolyticus]MBY3779359.1 head completion/stabilization protein [Vibrio parahaemolyticus]